MIFILDFILLAAMDTPRNYTSPVDGHHYGVGVRQVFEDFEPDGALAGNYLRVVKGVYKDGAGFFLQTHCFGICLVIHVTGGR